MDDILSTHPKKDTFDQAELRAAIDAVSACANACATCADSCLHGGHADDMVRCIDLCTQCATICRATADVLSRPGPDGDSWRSILQACIDTCRECEEECADSDHGCCQACAQACRDCISALETLLKVAD